MGEWRYSDRICMVLVCVVVSCNWLNWSASLPRAEGKFQNAPMCLKDFENRFRMCASLHVSKLRLITLRIRMTRPQHAWKSRVYEVSRVQSLKSSSGLAEVWHVDTMWTTKEMKKWHEDPIEVQHSADILSFWHVNIDYAWLCRCAFAELLPRRNTTTRLCQATCLDPRRRPSHCLEKLSDAMVKSHFDQFGTILETETEQKENRNRTETSRCLAALDPRR